MFLIIDVICYCGFLYMYFSVITVCLFCIVKLNVFWFYMNNNHVSFLHILFKLMLK